MMRKCAVKEITVLKRLWNAVKPSHERKYAIIKLIEQFD